MLMTRRLALMLRYKVTKNVTGEGVYISSVQLRYLMIIHVLYIPYMYIVVIRECRIFLFSVCVGGGGGGSGVSKILNVAKIFCCQMRFSGQLGFKMLQLQGRG